MFDSGTIYADGRMHIDGYEDAGWRLLAINGKLCVIHRPGGNWSDNGGRHYGVADITVREIKTLRRGNEPGTWRVHFVRMGASINFHPTPKVACREAMQELADRGDALVEHFSKKVV